MITRSFVINYLVALMAVAGAIALRVALGPLLHDNQPYTVNYVAIALVAAYVGVGPAVLATSVSVPASMYFVLQPRGSFAVDDAALGWGLALYAVAALATVLIVHSRRRAIERADRRGELLRITLASIGDAVVTTDAESAVTSLNPVAETLTGWSAGDALGRPVSEVCCVVDEATRRSVANPVTRALREQRRVGSTSPTVLIAKDGAERPIEDNAAPLHDRGGQLLGCVLVFRDITARRQGEARVQAVTAALEESNRRKEEFLAILAHELRNPLAPQMNAVELLKRSVTDEPVGRRAIALLDRQLRLMVRLIDDLIDLGRISRNALTLKRKRVDIVEIGQHACEVCRFQFTQADVELRMELPSAPLYVHADPERMVQVITNLLNNACKFTAPGGSVALAIAVVDRRVEISVTDTGIGIQREFLTSIFEMFVQVESAAEWTERGLGIGLSLAAQLMALHGGTIAAYSEGPGKGARFVVQLPLAEAPHPDAAPRAVPQDGARPRRVLIVDDNEDAADSLAMLLSIAGHTVRTAYDGPQALELAAEFTPELILLDVGLPRMSGTEVCRALRASEAQRETTIVAVTGWNQTPESEPSSAVGFDAHLVKPIDYETLTHLIATLPARACEEGLCASS